MKDDVGVEESNSILRLAVQSKYSENDVTLLTKMQVTIPMTIHDLRQHVKNIAGLASKCFGEEAVLTHSLQDLEDHMCSKEMSYVYEFRQDSLFGGDILDKVHWGMHRFFDSCAAGDLDKIDTSYLDFMDTMREVERRKFHCKPPAWITKLIKSKERRPGAEKIKEGTGPRGGEESQDI